MKTHIVLSTAFGALALASGARATEIFVTTDISVSTTWTANNTYNLTQQIYVLPGATLTIQAGTVVASTTNVGGSLAVCKGAQIFVQGTELAPVIMTSTADQATWTGGNPKTGTWREAERVLAGFNDGLADEGPAAGEASLTGLKIAREKGWTAPEAKK